MKKCQKCLSENDDSMSFCWECGTPLPDLAQTTSDTQKLPTQSFSDTPTIWSGNSETETLVNKRVGFTSNFQQPLPPPKSKKSLFLIVGGIAAFLFLGGLTVLGIAVYNMIPPKSIPFTPTSTPWDNPTPNASPSPKTTPNVSFTPPIEPTKKGSFTIYANSGWQLSEIDTVPKEEFRTTVQGKIDLAGIKTGVSASGVNDAKTKSRRIYQEFPTGALLMRTRYADGKYSNVVSLTTNGSSGIWQNYPDERGRIEFCINDNAPENNGGQFAVTVTMTKLPIANKK